MKITRVTVGLVGCAVTAAAAFASAEDKTPHGKRLDLRGYRLVFEEEFDKPLDVSARGPGTRWTAHTPWNGDFGDAAFSDPEPDFPFTVQDGILRIEARKEADGHWRSGLLASNAPDGSGFS